MLSQDPGTAGGLEFHDSLVPALEAGTYRITTGHAIDGVDTGDYFDTPVVRTLEVQAARFALPGGAVHGVYPVDGATGTFDQLLPHITLDTPPLPWERTLTGAPPVLGQPAVPWLAVLLFAEGELPGDPSALGRTEQMTVADLLATPASEAIAPALTDVEPADRATGCRTVDVPAQLFAAIAPRTEELGRLVHLRRGEDEPSGVRSRGDRTRARSLRGVHRAAPPRWWHTLRDDASYEGLHAVVVGNRFPATTGGQYTAHLVSLEGFAKYLDGSTVASAPLRLVSLRSWSFRSLPDSGAHFGTLVENLAAPGRQDAAALGLRLPLNGATGEAGDRLAQGYTPLAHRLDSGEQSYAWYRGPLTPLPTQALPQSVEHSANADARLVYLEEHGLFDVSYAAAWNLGRSLALADPQFPPALMAWRAVARAGAGRMLAARGRAGSGSLTGTRAATDRLGAAAAIGARPARQAFETSVRGGLSDTLTTALANPPDRTAADRRPARARPTPPPRAAAPWLRGQLAQPEAREALRAVTADAANPVLDWLDRLALLHPVPLEQLVPRQELLPTESLRFFYVDRAWQEALVDGALSIGIASGLDSDLTTLLHDVLTDLPARLSGFLVRSSLVPGWPALRMHLYAGEDELTVLRADTLGEDVLLVLVDGVVDRLVVAEPPQGLHFGIQDGDVLHLRNLKGDTIGTTLPGVQLTNVSSGYLRPDTRVLDVAGIGEAITAALGDHAQEGGLSAAGWAIQMVKAAQQMTFQR
ncbi:hypothetical protein ACFVVA_00425 [Kitasatospora sp. NPDC058048]|uniref:hypothetical protein n=1 Tax=Kitasatospora sp. NPDC058048 TaxID=3346313 RepID=UPI0036D76B49